MRNYLIIFFALLFCDELLSQVKGEYIGSFTQKNERYNIIGETDTIINGKATKWVTAKKVEWDGEKKLMLQSNGNFFFQYKERGEPCAARTSTRKCTGRYKIKNDTLLLTSRYKQTDFYAVTEKIIDTIAAGYIMVVANYPDDILRPATFINGFDLQVNDSLIGEFKIKDTIYCKTPDVGKLFFSCCSPYQMEWNYIPQNAKANFFKVTLIREIDGENIFMDNAKLLIKRKKLIAVKGEYLDVKDAVYTKK